MEGSPRVGGTPGALDLWGLESRGGLTGGCLGMEQKGFAEVKQLLPAPRGPRDGWDLPAPRLLAVGSSPGSIRLSVLLEKSPYMERMGIHELSRAEPNRPTGALTRQPPHSARHPRAMPSAEPLGRVPHMLLFPVQMGVSPLCTPGALSPPEPCHPIAPVTPPFATVPPLHGTTRALAGTQAALCKGKVFPISPRHWFQASPATRATSQAEALAPIQEGKGVWGGVGDGARRAESSSPKGRSCCTQPVPRGVVLWAKAMALPLFTSREMGTSLGGFRTQQGEAPQHSLTPRAARGTQTTLTPKYAFHPFSP